MLGCVAQGCSVVSYGAQLVTVPVQVLRRITSTTLHARETRTTPLSPSHQPLQLYRSDPCAVLYILKSIKADTYANVSVSSLLKGMFNFELL